MYIDYKGLWKLYFAQFIGEWYTLLMLDLFTLKTVIILHLLSPLFTQEVQQLPVISPSIPFIISLVYLRYLAHMNNLERFHDGNMIYLLDSLRTPT
jgi:hypothetical protein